MATLREQLIRLKEQYSLAGVKGGTEVEAMNFGEIRFLRQVSQDIVPMTVKIGGPEARNDISFMLDIGVDQILAPMIESPYSLKNFVNTMAALDKQHKARLAINIETIFAFYNLNKIFEAPAFSAVNQVTIGRSDLSSSMERDVDDAEVIRVTCEIVDLAHIHGKRTSVGGRVSTGNAKLVEKRIPSNMINTRHMVTHLRQGNATDNIAAALAWERAFYLELEKASPVRKEFYRARVQSVEERMAQAPATSVPAVPTYIYSHL